MKKTIQLLAIGATVAMFTLTAAARNLLSQPETAVQDQCTQENKDAWYASFIEIRKTDETKAYDIAKKYLTCAAAEDNKITQYLKKWVDSYEKGNRKAKLSQFLVEKKYAEAFAIGKDILTDEPENVKVMIDLGYGGYVASTAKNTSFNADAINYAKKAIQLIESGKTPDTWAPFTGKDDALAYLNYSIGVMTVSQDPSAALSYLIKSAQFGDLKKSPLTYAFIAGAYEEGPYAKQSADYKKLYEGKDESPESKLALANIQQLVDRMIDAYARAVSAAGTDPKFAASKPGWVEGLSTWYKYRHDKSDAGMNDMVASILSKPLPPEPTPITSLPASAPASTPATGTGNGAPATPGAAVPTGTPGNKPAAATNTPATTTPAASKTPVPASPSKKPRSNHKRT